jgi:hypothetical protein
MVFTWGGKQFEITGYSEITDTSGTSGLNGGALGIITFADVYSIHPSYVGTGIAARADSALGNNNTLKAGLDSGSQATITVNISTTRATSHDFLDIGTGGYNTTNYPDRIYGAPIELPVTDEQAVDSNGNNSKAQVQERVRGRVFFASTDQDGFFRVGRFFTVDQGTGRVTFNAALVLTNIDGIGFKRGVRVNEFSPDTTFTNATADTVPTETAVEGYINKRLGWDRDGNAILLGDVIGGGAIRKSGDAMTGNLSMGGNQITNLSTPTAGTDAANKNYVDGLFATQDELEELADVAISSPLNAEVLVYNGTTSKWTNEGFSSDPLVSDITFSYSAGVLSAQYNSGSIVNADVSATAAITQSKLSMNAATTRANATGITQGDRGLASFNSTEFTASSGWISVATGGIANSKLTNSSFSVTDGTTASSISLGGTLTFAATANETTVAQAGGTVTVGLPDNVTVAGVLTVGGNLVPGLNSPTDSGQQLGLSTRRWNTVYATTFNGTATEALYADLAENYLADAEYEPGTVLVFGGAQEVTVTNAKGDRRVAGVVTTNPAHLMNSALQGDFVTGVALQGRVPVKVLGKVHKGDLVVTSAIPGYGIVDNDPRIGTVIGKAVAEKLDDSRGIVEVVVGRV